MSSYFFTSPLYCLMNDSERKTACLVCRYFFFPDCSQFTVRWANKCGACGYRVPTESPLIPSPHFENKCPRTPSASPSSHTQSLTPGWPCCLPDLLLSQQGAFQPKPREGSGSPSKRMLGWTRPQQAVEGRSWSGFFFLFLTIL